MTERSYARNMNFEPTISSSVSPGKIVSSSEEETSTFNGNDVDEGVAIARLDSGVPRDMSTSVQQEPGLGQEQEEGQEIDEETLITEQKMDVVVDDEDNDTIRNTTALTATATDVPMNEEKKEIQKPPKRSSTIVAPENQLALNRTRRVIEPRRGMHQLSLFSAHGT